MIHVQFMKIPLLRVILHFKVHVHNRTLFKKYILYINEETFGLKQYSKSYLINVSN